MLGQTHTHTHVLERLQCIQMFINQCVCVFFIFSLSFLLSTFFFIHPYLTFLLLSLTTVLYFIILYSPPFCPLCFYSFISLIFSFISPFLLHLLIHNFFYSLVSFFLSSFHPSFFLLYFSSFFLPLSVSYFLSSLTLPLLFLPFIFTSSYPSLHLLHTYLSFPFFFSTVHYFNFLHFFLP